MKALQSLERSYNSIAVYYNTFPGEDKVDMIEGKSKVDELISISKSLFLNTCYILKK